MKITLTNNYYQGLAVNKNNQNKKNIQNNRTVTNSVAFSGPQLTRRAASGSSTRPTKALARTTQHLKVFLLKMFNKDASITVNGITYTNPKFYKGTNIIKSCECATRGCLDQEGLRTYINPEYDENGNIKSCESATKEYNGRDDKLTKEISVNPKVDINGNIKSCDSLTKEYDSKESPDKLKSKSYVNPEFDGNGKLIRCDSLTTEYNGRDDKVKKETFVDYRFGEYRKHITEFEDGRIVEESRPQRHHMFQKEKAR